MTTSPIPVEQFGTWLGELVASLQTLADESSGAESSTSQSSPFQSGPAKLLHTIAHGLRDSNPTTVRPIHFNDFQTARAAARLRDQIIHNLGST
jgi:hypothetical protein